MACVEARGLRKRHRGGALALDGVDLTVEPGRVVGLIGPNGAGKSTLLSAILGLTPYEGELHVLGHRPWEDRDRLLQDVAFIADVAVLPRWLRVSQAVDFCAGVHPRFDRSKAEAFLERTSIKSNSRVRELSKGMLTQLHLALALAVDARLLVLDEPTLGLDLIYRKQVFDTLLGDYLDGERSIILATHQVDEVQDVLTDVVFLNQGRAVLDCSMEALEARFSELLPAPERLDEARALSPIAEHRVFGRSRLLYDGADRERLAGLGEVRAPRAAEVFVAMVGPRTGGEA